MRIALLSDLHGNEVALEAVLVDVGRRGVDQIVCLGDTATLGPRPREVLARLRELGCPCILGNHDAFMLDAELVHTYAPALIVVEAVAWCRAQITTADQQFIASFLPALELPLENESHLLLFHGTPRSHMEELLCTTAPEIIDEMLAGQVASVMAGGHTHIQMLRQHRGALLVNPGSVGLPFEQHVTGRAPTILPHAEWACIESTRATTTVSLHRVELDRAALRTAVSASDNPLGPTLVAQYA